MPAPSPLARLALPARCRGPVRSAGRRYTLYTLRTVYPTYLLFRQVRPVYTPALALRYALLACGLAPLPLR